MFVMLWFPLCFNKMLSSVQSSVQCYVKVVESVCSKTPKAIILGLLYSKLYTVIV